jgi:putative membrane protein
MQKASTYFTTEERATIEKAVVDAEMKTSAEIMPVVATSSGRYDRPEDIFGLWLGVIAAGVVGVLFPAGESGDWGVTMAQWHAIAVLIALVAGFVLGAVIASYVGWLRRLFTPRAQMRDEVDARSRGVFFDSRVHHTKGATGLLVYVSLYEHMAVILGDQEVLNKLGQPALDELCKELTAGLHAGRKADAIAEVIRDAGAKLGAVLPRADDDVNELADTLVLID